MPALNTIFYGPPGTGKTYRTSQQAVQLIESLSDEALREKYPTDARTALKKQFNQYQKEGRIALVTFHPSFAYEDFVEGIKPFKNERNELYYDVEDGIFKRLCFNAAYSLYLAQQKRSLDKLSKSPSSQSEYTRPFDALYFEFVDYLKRMMQEGAEEITFETKQGKALMLTDINQNNTLTFRTTQGNKSYLVTKNSLSKLHQAFPTIDSIVHLSRDISRVVGRSNTSVMWSAFHRLKTFENTRYQTYNYLLNNQRLSGQPLSEVQYNQMKHSLQQLDYSTLTSDDYRRAGNFVLIIDEINRGNPASIFGELISLIEPDKRAGKPEALQTVLPYTRETFRVPPNLFILGTMNTADRSIDALDRAFKRRFAFHLVSPDPALLRPAVKIPGLTPTKSQDMAQAAEPESSYGNNKIYLDRFCDALNQRLLWLKGDEFQIGHAYLMPVITATEPLTALRSALYQHIIPLLEDYFIDDWENIIYVLGADFVEEVDPPENSPPFRRDDFSTPYPSHKVFRWRNLNDDELVTAIQQTYAPA